MSEYFQNKNIWIIGASSGIGRALAKNLSNEGAGLILSARSEDKLKAVNEELGGHHMVLPLDVTDAQKLQDLSNKMETGLPHLDSVIYLAAIYEPQSLDNLDLEKTSKLIDVNLKGAFKLIHAVLPYFKRQNYGQIALCGSIAGFRGLPNGQPYSATKAAIINLAESLRAEQGENNIDVKVINPGFVKTPMTDKNEFEMPMIIEPEQAANAIAKGLRSNGFEIHFPKRFTYILKILRLLPAALYFPIARKIMDR